MILHSVNRNSRKSAYLPSGGKPLAGIALSISKHTVVSLSELPPDLDYSLECHHHGAGCVGLTTRKHFLRFQYFKTLNHPGNHEWMFLKGKGPTENLETRCWMVMAHSIFMAIPWGFTPKRQLIFSDVGVQKKYCKLSFGWAWDNS